MYDYDKSHWTEKCPKIDCKKPKCGCGLKYYNLPAALGDDSETSSIAPKKGNYHDAIVEYESNGHKYLYSTEGVPVNIEGDGGTNDFNSLDNRPKYAGEEMTSRTNIPDVASAIEGEATARESADEQLQEEIDAMKNSPDVVDIVATYADLQAYDTSSLGDNDIVRVLRDEMHDGVSTYYRWNGPNTGWNFIGTVGDYYTISQVDTLLAGKQDTLTAGANIQISNDTISATDTTYSDFVGTDGTAAGTAGLVPAPATTDAGKFLKADGTWDTAGSTVNVVQTTGTSTTDVMSQNATTSMVFADPSNKTQIQIGAGAGVASTSNSGIAIGNNSLADKNYSIAIGPQAKAYAAGSISIGHNAKDGSSGINSSITIGSSLTNNGFNNIGISATGNSTIGTGVQNAVLVGTAKIANSTYGAVSIGGGPDSATYNVVNNTGGVAIGGGKATVSGDYAVALGGWGATASGKGSVALGSYSSATSQGEVNIGSSSTSYGYSNTNYRLISGVHDPQNAHDAATKGYVDTAVAGAGGANTISSQDWSDLWQ